MPQEAADPEIAALAESYDRDPRAVTEVLRVLQKRYGGFPERLIEDTARSPGIGVASVCSMLSMKLAPTRTLAVYKGPRRTNS
jgi:hypothetical protein